MGIKKTQKTNTGRGGGKKKNNPNQNKKGKILMLKVTWAPIFVADPIISHPPLPALPKINDGISGEERGGNKILKSREFERGSSKIGVQPNKSGIVLFKKIFKAKPSPWSFLPSLRTPPRKKK